MVPNIKNRDSCNAKKKSNETEQVPCKDNYKLEIVWFNIGLFIFLHTFAFLGFMDNEKRPLGVLIGWIFGLMGGFGITAGAHRLYAHRSYKANVPLRLFLVLGQTIACQNHMYEWVRDHRVHHKFTETNADPHNAARGFFFSHIGWLMCKKHPDVRNFGKKVDMSDLEADAIVMFQKKYYVPLTLFFSFILPIGLTYYLCPGVPFIKCFSGHIYRYCIQLHLTWLTNSYAHMFGNHPFDANISATDTMLIGILGFGEGWHNYHHAFPFDYKTSELGRWWCNFTIPFIGFFAWLGWATDLKTVSNETIRLRVLRTGDGSHRYSKEAAEKKIQADENPESSSECFWGWGDRDMGDDLIKSVTIYNQTIDAKKVQ